MKKLLPILAVILFSCSKPKDLTPPDYMFGSRKANSEVLQEITQYADLPPLGDVNKKANPYIPEDESGWVTSDPSGRIGLYRAYKRVELITVDENLVEAYDGKVTLGQLVVACGYNCVVGNGVKGDVFPDSLYKYTLSGERDWVVDRAAYSGGTYLFKGYLQVVVYKNGEVVLSRKKEDVYFANNEHRVGAPTGQFYPGNVMFMNYGHGDLYFNTAIISLDPNDIDGEYVIVVTIAPYGNVPGDDLSDNTGYLPMRVAGGVPVTDTSAFSANAAKPATNYKAVPSGKGRSRGNLITWEGSSYAYCIERWNPDTNQWDMILRWFDGRSFFDADGNMKSIYRIVSRTQGDKMADAWTPQFKVSKK